MKFAPLAQVADAKRRTSLHCERCEQLHYEITSLLRSKNFTSRSKNDEIHHSDADLVVDRPFG